MAGNRKHGYLRGNRGGFRPEPWRCDGCSCLRSGTHTKNGTLDGKFLCDPCDNKRLAKEQLSRTTAEDHRSPSAQMLFVINCLSKGKKRDGEETQRWA